MYGLSNYEISQVLLIEDNPADARLVEILLEESDLHCEITGVKTLSAGLKLLEENEYTAVLLDLSLPDSKGFDTLERLLSIFPEVNVIVLTGLAAKDLGLKAVKIGAQDFLVKGDFDADQLAKSLRYSIERNSILNRLEEAQKTAHIGNWVYHTEERVFTASDEVYRIFGYEPKSISLTYRFLLRHLHKSDRPFLEELYEGALIENESKQDLRILTKNGDVRYVSILCSRTKDQYNNNQFRGILQDVTERKLAEVELIKSQERYQAIFTQSKDAIYISTIEGSFLNFNQATADLYAYSAVELRQLNVRDLYKNTDDYTKFESAMETYAFVQDMEVEMLRKDGRVRRCLITASELRTEDFQGYNTIIRDITERSQTEELRKGKEVAERTAAMRERFIANVSHEMRTPMNAILGMTNLITRDNLNEEQNGYLNSITQSSQHLLGIINDILEVSSIQNEGKVKLKKEKFNLHDTLNNLIKIYEYQTKEKDIELILKVESDVEEIVIGDGLRLNQVLTNLTNNAIKFTEKGYVKIWVRKVDDTDDITSIRFIIEDTGIGIPDDKLSDIFETFVRVRTSNKLYPGTGLGLAIAKQLVELQGGTIDVFSEMNEGSTFTVAIEFEKVEAAKEEEVPEEDLPIILPDIGRPVEILLVEDHKLNQIVAKRTIEKEWDNVKVTIAGNGQIALDYLMQKEYDIILMDIQMPVLDGYEATKRIRNTFPHPKSHIPILAMTAHAHISQDEKFRDYGMDDYVLKPFDPKDLFTKIVYYVTNRDKFINNNTNQPINKEKMNGTPQYIDLSYMDMMADGDVEMKKMMLELLFDEPYAEIKKMHNLYNTKNWKDLKAVSHKMKSTLAFVGNNTLTKINKKIERIAMEGAGFDELPDLISTLDDLFQKALNELKYTHSQL